MGNKRKAAPSTTRPTSETASDNNNGGAACGEIGSWAALETDPVPSQEVTLTEDMRQVLGMTVEEWDAIQAASAAQSAGIPKQVGEETAEERTMRMEEEEEGQEMVDRNHEQFRREWNDIWSHFYGSFEDTTRIPPMRFTYKPPTTDDIVYTLQTLQIFSAKVTEIRGGLQWPLDVFGFIAIRDCIDRNRNIIFNRERDNCQTLTQEDHSLVLAGPTRAIVLNNMQPVTIEICLKVKGTTESEDKDLSFLAVPFMCDHSYKPQLFNKAYYTSKLSTLGFTLGRILQSVEATVVLRILCGSWPDDGNVAVMKEEVFTPLKAGLSSGGLDIGFCVVEVNVAWSLISSSPVYANRSVI